MRVHQQFTATTRIHLAEDDHLVRPLLGLRDLHPGHAIAGYRDGDVFVDVTVRDFVDTTMELARGLIGCGVQPGARVALMSRTRVEWMQCDYAILAAGAVSVPIYDTSSAEQVRWILADSGATVLIVETEDHLRAYQAFADDLPNLAHVFVMDRGGLAELADRGRDVAVDELDRRLADLTVGDLATIIYTSGTTGRPKGCMLTHANLRTNVRQSLEVYDEILSDEDRTLFFLPLAHSLARIIALLAIERGITIYMATDLAHVPEELGMVHPTLVVSVPRVFEKIYNRARHTADEAGRVGIFDRAADIATRYSIGRHGGRVPLGVRLQHRVFDALVYRRLRAAMGGQLRFAISGGGPLGERLTRFFDGVGVSIYEGYGLTETSPVLTVNVPGGWRPGTVGRPVPDTTIGIAEDGEVVAHGPQVFSGYWHNEEATAEVFEDDWFLTGDIGALDDDGYLRITGRKKDLIVTASGKNVAPAPLEDTLRAHPLISQAIVVGEGRPFIGALIALDEEELAQWAADRGRPGATLTELLDDPAIQAEVQQAVDRANAQVSRAESIRAFRILPRDLTIISGELTPTLKVRRAMLLQEFAVEVEAVFSR